MLLSLVLHPLRDHVSDVLLALVLLTVSAAAVARESCCWACTWIGRLYGKQAARERELREKAERSAEKLMAS